MRVTFTGALPKGIYAKDLVLALIRKIGHDGATGHVIEYAGEAISALSVEGRMTICNMSIEAGAKAGMVAPDPITIAYLRGRDFVPKGEAFDTKVQEWEQLYSDADAVFDKEVVIDVSALAPQVTWGTNPGQVMGINETVPLPADDNAAVTQKSLHYMGLEPGVCLTAIPVSHVFIGSCTNSRIEDLREAANIAAKGQVAKGVRAIVVPGSMRVKAQAEQEGLDDIFIKAGFEWRLPGCSMCLGMNDDVLGENDRCASTSNRNFEGRQGRGARTHLVSPAMAAGAALHGKFIDINQYES